LYLFFPFNNDSVVQHISPLFSIFLLYAKLEEEHGLGRHAMAVYDRAIEAVDANERFGLFNIYLKKASEIYGVTRDQFYKTFYSCNLQLLVIS
jgi:hypothetical protein